MVQRMRMARHCAQGLRELHTYNILHRDIKSMNILLSEDFTCKITDFGCAKLVPNQSESNQLNTLNSGTPLWMAPEVKLGNYGYPCDVYSLGLVLYEIFSSTLPTYDPRYQTVVMPQQYKFYSVIHACIRLDPNRRPRVTDLVDELNRAIDTVMRAVYEILPKEEKSKIDVEGNMDETLVELYRHLVKDTDQNHTDNLINQALERNPQLQGKFNLNAPQYPYPPSFNPQNQRGYPPKSPYQNMPQMNPYQNVPQVSPYQNMPQMNPYQNVPQMNPYQSPYQNPYNLMNQPYRPQGNFRYQNH